MEIFPASESDVPEIRAIYKDAVLYGTGTFEEDPPSPQEMHSRMTLVQQNGWPWLVAKDTQSGQVLGYAYLSPFRTRSAYRFTLEDSVYVRADARGKGIATALITRLEHIARALDIKQIVAVVGDSGNVQSIKLHEKLGFTRQGRFENVGFKFGRWLDVVFLQKCLDSSIACLKDEPAGTTADL
jgi:phosphinothricin acetyltransferase